jgi:hypothetical protein
MKARLTSQDFFVLSLLGVSDHVLNSGGRVAAQLCEAHGQASCLTSHSVVLDIKRSFLFQSIISLSSAGLGSGIFTERSGSDLDNVYTVRYLLD